MTALEIFQQILKTEKLSQSEAARRIGITRGAVSNYLTGQKPLSFESLERYAEMLGHKVKIILENPKEKGRYEKTRYLEHLDLYPNVTATFIVDMVKGYYDCDVNVSDNDFAGIRIDISNCDLSVEQLFVLHDEIIKQITFGVFLEIKCGNNVANNFKTLLNEI
jgi:transcriptional regulator with XRE-family HTH domain